MRFSRVGVQQRERERETYKYECDPQVPLGDPPNRTYEVQEEPDGRKQRTRPDRAFACKRG